MASAEWQGESPGSDKVKWHAIPPSSPPPHHHHAKDENTADFANESHLSSPCPGLSSAWHAHISLKHASRGGSRREWRKAKENVLFLTLLLQRSHRFLSEVPRQMAYMWDTEIGKLCRGEIQVGTFQLYEIKAPLKKKNYTSIYINWLPNSLYLGLSLYLCFTAHFSNPQTTQGTDEFLTVVRTSSK